MYAASSVVRVDVTVVQENVSIGVRSIVERTGVPPISTPLLEGGSKKGDPLVMDTTAMVEIPPSMSALSTTDPPGLPPVVVRRLKHVVCMQTTPKLAVSTGGSKLVDSHLKIIDYEMGTLGAIDNHDEDNPIESAHIRSTAYRVCLREIESDTRVALDNFPVCGHVEAKADGSNINRLVLPIKHLSDVRSYLIQWKAVYGCPGFLCLLELSSNAAEQATYDIAHVADAEWVQEIPAA